MVRRSLALLMLCMGALFLVPALAQADTGNIVEPQTPGGSPADGWQAGTCTTDTPKCSPATPGQFFKTAAGHPPKGFTQYTIQHEPITPLPSPPFPAGAATAVIKPELEDKEIKILRVDLPPGLTVNPQATTGKCSQADFEREIPGVGIVPACDPSTQVGEEEVTVVTNAPNAEVGGNIIPVAGFIVPPTPGVTKIPVYNLEPEEGEPARFGFVAGLDEKVILKTQVAWESDFHESFTIELPEADIPGLSTLISRLINFGDITGNGTYITNPTTCFDPEAPAFEHLYSTWFRAESYGEENPTFPTGSTPFEAALPAGVQQDGCDNVPFEPTIDVAPGTTKVDSPSDATVETKLPFDPVKEGGTTGISQSHLRKAQVTLPAGMGLNPAGSVGLVACTDAQFAKGQRVETTPARPPRKSARP